MMSREMWGSQFRVQRANSIFGKSFQLAFCQPRENMSADKKQALLKVVARIPMFTGLGLENTALVVDACEFRNADKGEFVCKIKEPSDELFILLSGKLTVLDAKSMEIASLVPVTPVGEMGLFTGQARSATVKVAEKSTLLVLKKAAFERLVRQTPAVSRPVYRNVVQTLQQRLEKSRSQRDLSHVDFRELETKLQSMREETEKLRGGD